MMGKLVYASGLYQSKANKPLAQAWLKCHKKKVMVVRTRHSHVDLVFVTMCPFTQCDIFVDLGYGHSSFATGSPVGWQIVQDWEDAYQVS